MNYDVFACRCRMNGGEQTLICSPSEPVANLKLHPNANYFKQSRGNSFLKDSYPTFNFREPISIFYGATYEKNIYG
jgi:hypothetical protein